MVHKQVNLFEKKKKRRKFYDEFADRKNTLCNKTS
jgi:hypothetical protein